MDKAKVTEIRDANISRNNTTEVSAYGTKNPLGTRGGGDTGASAVTAGIVGIFNRAAKLKSGNILVSFAGRRTCFQYDPTSGKLEFLFTLGHEQNPFLWRVIAARDGTIYCTLSGSRDATQPTADSVFGLAGAIIRLDLRMGEIEALATGADLVDPCGMQEVSGSKLCVTDFRGFGGAGAIYTVDTFTAERNILLEGQGLVDCVSSYLDSSGTLWVANAYMNYVYPIRSGGIHKDDGEVLKYSAGGPIEVVMPRTFPPSGSVVGINHSADNDHLIVVRGDWPLMETGSVLLLDKRDGDYEVLLSATPDKPRFYSTHVDVVDGVLWVGESYEKKLLAYDLKEKRIVSEIDFTSIMGGYLGVASSFEGMESVSIVP